MRDPRSKSVPPEWRAPIEDWIGWLIAANRSQQTIATRTDHVRRMARALGGSPWRVKSVELIAWVGGQEWATETRRSVYASIRGFFRWGVELGHITTTPAGHLPSVRPADPRPRPAPDHVLASAIRAADARTILILRLAAEAGLRRGEIAMIHARDLAPDLGGWSLLVHGKGGRDRWVPLSTELAATVRLGAGGGWLFPGRADGHISARRIGELAVDVLPAGWTLHTLRHRFATRAHDATHDLIAVSRLLGHASVATTQRYVATDSERLRAVAAAAA